MIFASPKNKGFAANSEGASDTEALNPVEKTLREAAAWEPLCPPPADFAAFTRRALENHARAALPPASNRPVAPSKWVRGLRAPLAASLALGLVLWMGGSVNDLSDLSVPDQVRETGRPIVTEKPAAQISASQTPEKSGPLARTTKKAHSAAQTAAPDTIPSPRSRAALTNRRARVRGHKSRGAGRDEIARAAKQANPAPLWKTETVERPAWGALIPATLACGQPASEAGSGSESDETETTLMPVVLDVALPESANLAAVSQTDAPPSTAP